MFTFRLSSKNDYRKDVKQDVIIRRAVPFSDWNHSEQTSSPSRYVTS